MPEFILDYGAPAAEQVFKSLDAFTQGYLEAAFFTSTGDGDDAENGLQEASLAEMADSAWLRAIEECKAFQEANAALLARSYDMGFAQGHYDATRAGNDYWYTRNGHGTGYWDRGLGAAGDQLAAAARYSERYLVRGDDGLIYIE